MWSKSQLKILPITYLIVAVLIILLTALLKNKSTRIKTIPLAIIAGLMIIGEIIKISLSIIWKQFTTWQIPLHYCSLFMLWFFLSCFFTKKSRHVFYALDIAMGIPVVIIFLIYPSSMLRVSTDFLFNGGTFYHYHNFLYHIFIILFLGLLISLKLYKPKISDLKYVLICFYAWVAVATIGSNLLNESYANLLTSDFAALDSIRTQYGYPLYLLCLYFAGFIIVAGSFLAFIGIKKLLVKNKSEEPVEILMHT